MDLKIDDLLEKVNCRLSDYAIVTNVEYPAKGQQASPGFGIRTTQRTESVGPLEESFRQAMIMLS